MINQILVDSVIDITRQAGDAINEIYMQIDTVEVNYKEDDSPLTQADLAAHQILVKGLSALLPNIPILSEEGELPPFETRRAWRQYWLIDPLDGTKEFINRNGEFTVNVALIENGRPQLGVVFVPVTNTTYWGAAGLGAGKKTPQGENAIASRSLDAQAAIVVVASRRHGAEAVQAVLKKLSGAFADVKTTNMGSSLKLCLIAEGQADIYPRLAPTSEWDTAAAQAVVEAAGGEVVDANFQTLQYNQKDSVLNPHFYVWGDKKTNWQDILK